MLRKDKYNSSKSQSHFKSKLYKNEANTAVLKSHNISFPSWDADSKWNQDLECHLHAVIQDVCDWNKKLGARVPVIYNIWVWVCA